MSQYDTDLVHADIGGIRSKLLQLVRISSSGIGIVTDPNAAVTSNTNSNSTSSQQQQQDKLWRECESRHTSSLTKFITEKDQKHCFFVVPSGNENAAQQQQIAVPTTTVTSTRIGVVNTTRRDQLSASPPPPASSSLLPAASPLLTHAVSSYSASPSAPQRIHFSLSYPASHFNQHHHHQQHAHSSTLVLVLKQQTLKLGNVAACVQVFAIPMQSGGSGGGAASSLATFTRLLSSYTPLIPSSSPLYSSLHETRADMLAAEARIRKQAKLAMPVREVVMECESSSGSGGGGSEKKDASEVSTRATTPLPTTKDTASTSQQHARSTALSTLSSLISHTWQSQVLRLVHCESEEEHWEMLRKCTPALATNQVMMMTTEKWGKNVQLSTMSGGRSNSPLQHQQQHHHSQQSQHQHIGPLSELHYWRSKLTELSSLYSSFLSDDVQRIKTVLQQSSDDQSTNKMLELISQLQERIHYAKKEAEMNVEGLKELQELLSYDDIATAGSAAATTTTPPSSSTTTTTTMSFKEDEEAEQKAVAEEEENEKIEQENTNQTQQKASSLSSTNQTQFDLLQTIVPKILNVYERLWMMNYSTAVTMDTSQPSGAAAMTSPICTSSRLLLLYRLLLNEIIERSLIYIHGVDSATTSVVAQTDKAAHWKFMDVVSAALGSTSRPASPLLHHSQQQQQHQQQSRSSYHNAFFSSSTSTVNIMHLKQVREFLTRFLVVFQEHRSRLISASKSSNTNSGSNVSSHIPSSSINKLFSSFHTLSSSITTLLEISSAWRLFTTLRKGVDMRMISPEMQVFYDRRRSKSKYEVVLREIYRNMKQEMENFSGERIEDDHRGANDDEKSDNDDDQRHPESPPLISFPLLHPSYSSHFHIRSTSLSRSFTYSYQQLSILLKNAFAAVKVEDRRVEWCEMVWMWWKEAKEGGEDGKQQLDVTSSSLSPSTFLPHTTTSNPIHRELLSQYFSILSEYGSNEIEQVQGLFVKLKREIEERERGWEERKKNGGGQVEEDEEFDEGDSSSLLLTLGYSYLPRYSHYIATYQTLLRRLSERYDRIKALHEIIFPDSAARSTSDTNLATTTAEEDEYEMVSQKYAHLSSLIMRQIYEFESMAKKQ